jgi:hypothetical protein
LWITSLEADRVRAVPNCAGFSSGGKFRKPVFTLCEARKLKMPNSQSHRPAVSMKIPPTSRVKKLLDRASDLEQQLSGLSKSNDEKAARLRSHLCEVLSDLLISDPVLATENDCSGRLWRSCFYAPIGVWRSRISREKRKQGPNLASLEQSFQRFLGEAVTLYDYLVLQYQAKLLPPSSQDSSQQSTQDSQLSEVPYSCVGVVSGLYRLYIHMGDLHRYGEAYGKAEACYANAFKLAPGMGNPYNQLAVVAQLKDANMSCVALYWYARSLLATHDSFQTSGSNLERLFTINKEYLKDHARDPKPPILPAINKKTSAELMRAQKTAASKSCLAHFVDFHYELMKNEKLDSGAEAMLREKLEAFHSSLQSLLQASAFGDSLLCKMVVVAAFSREMNSKSSNTVNRRLSEDLLFTIGTALGERLQHGLARIVDKAERLPPSIRLLLPVLLLCDYVGRLDSNYGRKAVILFWNQCVLTGNLALQLSKRFAVSVTTAGQPEVSWVSIKEYHSFRGFRPFSFLNADYSKQEPYVSPSEAVDILDLTQSQSQQSTQSAASGNDETVVKLVRFLQFYQRCAEDKTSPVWRVGDTFEYNGVDKALPNIETAARDMETKDDVDSENLMSVENIATRRGELEKERRVVKDPVRGRSRL